MCRTKCHLINGEIQPKFKQWEEFCHMTVGHGDEWDEECFAFYSCQFGCEIFGGDRAQFINADPGSRRSMMTQIAPANVLKEDACFTEQCRAWCARQSFGSCREAQYAEECEDSMKTTMFYECEGMRCSAATGSAGINALLTGGALLISSLLFLR